MTDSFVPTVDLGFFDRVCLEPGIGRKVRNIDAQTIGLDVSQVT